MKKHDGFICPVCGEAVPANAAACPGCGADERTGWSDQTIYDGTGIEDPAEFDHADWLERETGKSVRPRHISWFWWLAAIGVLALLIWALVVKR